jgi:hypothetical protein
MSGLVKVIAVGPDLGRNVASRPRQCCWATGLSRRPVEGAGAEQTAGRLTVSAPWATDRRRDDGT